MAYCLLSIFDINMPMRYGKGRRAFQRLQEEIVNHTDDSSLFAWLSPGDDQLCRGLFAKSPSQFERCSGIKFNVRATRPSPEFNITKRGIHFHTFLDRVEGDLSESLWMRLRNDCPDCSVEHEVYISVMPTGNGYVRVGAGRCFAPREGQELSFEGREWCRIRKHVDAEESRALEPYLQHPLRVSCELEETVLDEVTYAPSEYWDRKRWLFSGDVLSEDFVGIIGITTKPPWSFQVVCVVYQLLGEDANVPAFGRSTGEKKWDLVEGRGAESLPKVAYNIIATDLLLDEYRRRKRSGTYEPQTRLKFRRRPYVLIGEPREVTFDVRVKDGLAVVWSDEAAWEDGKTGSASGSTAIGAETEAAKAEDVVADGVSELALDLGASEQRTADGAGNDSGDPVRQVSL